MNLIKILKHTFVTSLALLVSSYTFSDSEIRYIDDTLRVPIRSGASTEHRIINFLDGGTKVEQKHLNENDEEWAFIAFSNDREGWVQTRYLKRTPAAKELLALSQQEVSKLKASNNEQNQTIKQLQAELKTLQKQFDELTKHSGKTDKELEHIKDISKNAIRLDHNNTQLLEENQLLKAAQEEHEQLIVKLENKQQNTGMIYGALAVLLGIILGWILPKLGGKRNDGWA